ncbi:MAG: hypothetical protein JO165_05105, partial [Candidatus Eremiobacteraeota bacterium]|nr:hypothetical protein [Candidatus Eremiobacteraeota bacterium]
FDEGTPIPLDEPQGQNPAYGAYFDYYLASAAPVDITLRDSHGNPLRHWSSTDKPPVVNEKAHDYPTYWVHAAQPPSGTVGGHRFVWNLLANERSEAGTIVAPPGVYEVTLRSNGATQTQRFEVKRDPRIHATDADLLRQYALANQVLDEYKSTSAGLQRAKALLASHANDPRLKVLAGSAPTQTPDDSVGKPAQDFSSLRFIADALQGLLGAVESADAAPTPEQYKAYAILHAKAQHALTELAQVK